MEDNGHDATLDFRNARADKESDIGCERRKMADKNRDMEGRDLLLGRPEGASRTSPGISSRSAEEMIRTTEELRQAVEDLRSAARERDEELLRKILEAVQAAEPRVDSVPQEELLRELLEALRTLRAQPGDSAVAEDAARVRELGERVLAAHRAADAVTEAVVALRDQTVAAREAFEETARRVGTDVAGLREASAKYERTARAASEEVLRRLRSLRPWRPWLAVPGAAAAAAGVLFLGALAQREFGVMDGLRHEWNAYVANRYAAPIAVCAAKAKLDGEAVVCRLNVVSPADISVPPAIAWPPEGSRAER